MEIQTFRIHFPDETVAASAAYRPETPAIDNNLQVSFENLFISASFFSGDTVLTV